jgi:superfamily II DNA or RNA helicase
VFATNIQHVESLVQCFKSQGISCAGVHSKISVAERNDILSRFSNEIINVIVNCSILTEVFILHIRTDFTNRALTFLGQIVYY